MALRLTIIMIAALQGAALAQPATIPAPAVPDGVGVNIHFTDPQPGEMEMLAAAGFRWIRMDFGWERTETAAGKYDFTPYDRLMAALQPRNIRPIFILDYSNRLYDGGESPHSDEGRRAFARWAAAAAKHFAGRGILWEMYNEPNITFWRPKPNVDDYVKLALATGQAIHAAEPAELYIGPATSTLDFAFLEACFKAGLLRHWAAVSVHPYRQAAPETAEPEYRRLRQLIAKYAPNGKAIPIISGEWGYSSGWSGMAEEKQGKMIARELLFNLASGVPVSIWYDWHDDGTDPKEPEHHFGTVLHAYHAAKPPVYDPKPAYNAAKTLSLTLGGYRFNKRLAMGSPEDWVLLFTKGNEQRLAVWTTDVQPHPVAIPASPGRFTTTSHTGESFDIVRAEGGVLTVTASDAPQYLVPEAPNALLQIAAAWDTAPLDVVTSAAAAHIPSLKLRNPGARSVLVDYVVTLGTRTARTFQSAFTRLVSHDEQDSGRLLSLTESGERLKPPALPRSAEPMRLRYELRVRGEGIIAQESMVLITDPLRVTPLPADTVAGDRRHYELRVRVENPSAQPFAGAVRLFRPDGLGAGVLREPFELKAGQTDTTVRLLFTGSPPPRYGFQLDLEGTDGKSVLSLPAASYAPVDSFGRYPAGQAPFGFRLIADGDAKVASEQTVVSEDVARGPVTGALKLTYKIDAGWKYLALAPRAPGLEKIEGQPKALGLWIFGDGKGMTPRLRVTDSTGQTFQPSSEPITWTGWRYITIPLTADNAGHWGGAKDGAIHYPIHWEAMFLLDNGSRQPVSGAVSIAAPTLIY